MVSRVSISDQATHSTGCSVGYRPRKGEEPRIKSNSYALLVWKKEVKGKELKME